MTLHDQVAVVAGATRGGGRAVAVELGAAGATVYVTGRSAGGRRSPMDRPETLEETAALVEAAGGTAILAPCDHTDPAQVRALAARVAEEQGGRLDLLVDSVWGGDHLAQWNGSVLDARPRRGARDAAQRRRLAPDHGACARAAARRPRRAGW